LLSKLSIVVGGEEVAPEICVPCKIGAKRLLKTAIIKQPRSNPNPPNGMSEYKIALFGSGGAYSEQFVGDIC
jgi:hypothetical protein